MCVCVQTFQIDKLKFNIQSQFCWQSCHYRDPRRSKNIFGSIILLYENQRLSTYLILKDAMLNIYGIGWNRKLQIQ